MLDQSELTAIMMPMFMVLGGIVVSLGGALVLVVRMLVKRMERKQDASDTHIIRLISVLERTVDKFEEFKTEEHTAHEKILDRLTGIEGKLSQG